MPLAHAQLVNTTRVKRVSGSNKIGGSAVMLAAGFWGAPRHRDLGIFILPRGSAGWNHPWNRLFQLQTRNSKAEVLHKISSFFNLPPWSTMTTFGRGRETFREREQTQVLDIRNKLPLPSTTMNAGKFSTSIFHTASMPSSGYSRTSTWHRSMARQSSVDDKKRGTFTRIFPQFANRIDGRGGDSRLTRARLELRSDGPCITQRQVRAPTSHKISQKGSSGLGLPRPVYHGCVPMYLALRAKQCLTWQKIRRMRSWSGYPNCRRHGHIIHESDPFFPSVLLAATRGQSIRSQHSMQRRRETQQREQIPFCRTCVPS